MDLTKRVNDVIIEYIQDRGSTPLQSINQIDFCKTVVYYEKH